MLGYNCVRQLAVALVALAILVGSNSASAAQGKTQVVVGSQHPEFSFSASISPHFLSRTKPSPVKLGLLSRFFPADAITPYPPALAEEKLLLDRHLELSTLGLPVCSVGLQVYPSTPVPERCKAAQVGTGTANVTISYPEEFGIRLDLKVHLYNGGARGGVTKLWLYFPVKVPVPTSILAPVEIRKVDQGAYGSEAVISMPKIAGGSGYFTQLWLNINREYNFKGERRSVAAFRCANGKFQFGGEASFLDGTQAIAEPAVRTCAVKR